MSRPSSELARFIKLFAIVAPIVFSVLVLGVFLTPDDNRGGLGGILLSVVIISTYAIPLVLLVVAVRVFVNRRRDANRDTHAR